MIDAHTELALKLFGEGTPTFRAKAKAINYMRFYSTSEVAVGRVAGIYPCSDLSAIELRVLANKA